MIYRHALLLLGWCGCLPWDIQTRIFDIKVLSNLINIFKLVDFIRHSSSWHILEILYHHVSFLDYDWLIVLVVFDLQTVITYILDCIATRHGSGRLIVSLHTLLYLFLFFGMSLLIDFDLFFSVTVLVFSEWLKFGVIGRISLCGVKRLLATHVFDGGLPLVWLNAPLLYGRWPFIFYKGWLFSRNLWRHLYIHRVLFSIVFNMNGYCARRRWLIWRWPVWWRFSAVKSLRRWFLQGNTFL